MLVENTQTTGPITTQAEQAAAANRVPVVKVTETLPEGVTDYVVWMNGQVDALAAALEHDDRRGDPVRTAAVSLRGAALRSASAPSGRASTSTSSPVNSSPCSGPTDPARPRC